MSANPATAAKTESAPKRDVQWADGLRGIACVAVVFSHGFEAFGWPANSFDGRPYVLTLPILRLILQGGYLAVGIFFVMSGYVCSIKPLKLARQGKPDEVRKVIASSIFRRLLRLGLPATIATTISWSIDRLGGFGLARSLPGNVWLCFHTPVHLEFLTSVRALFACYLRTWTFDGPTWTTLRNMYEAIQWTMAYEIRGSISVYLAIIVTSSFTPSCRVAVFLILMAYSVYCGDFLADMPFYGGALLADMSLVISASQSHTSTGSLSRFRIIRNYWPITLGMFGLILGSYPPDGTDLSAWSRMLTRLGNVTLPTDWSFTWAIPTIGAFFFIMAIHFSPFLRRIFSHPYAVFFGSISFPMYLIHSFLMRSFATWVMYGLIPQSRGLVARYGVNYDVSTFSILCGAIVDLLALSFCMAVLIYLSTLWRDRLDGLCVQFAWWVEKVMLGKDSLFGSANAIRSMVAGVGNQLNGQKHDVELGAKA